MIETRYLKGVVIFIQTILSFVLSSKIIFKLTFNDYDVRTLKMTYPITFQNYTKYPINLLQNKITSCNLFIERFPELHLNIFVPNVFNKRNLPDIQDKHFILDFNHAKESVSSKKNAARLSNRTEQTFLKRETKIYCKIN